MEKEFLKEEDAETELVSNNVSLEKMPCNSSNRSMMDLSLIEIDNNRILKLTKIHFILNMSLLYTSSSSLASF
jgi:hypothetical protein